MSPRFSTSPHYGNALHYVNLMIGRVALQRDRNLPLAKASLLAAARVPSTDIMQKYGPNMALARDLLAAGERDTVLEYFVLCRTLWPSGLAKLDEWAALVKADGIPDFGANLIYSQNSGSRSVPINGRRVVDMGSKQVPSAEPWVPKSPTLPLLMSASKHCEGCDLFRNATQTVFGEGPSDAAVVMVGEQPGDQEDLVGQPFVGPAGKLLDRALVEAGVDRDQVYVTNAVKHFKFIERGKRRIHGKPSGIEISACRPWLEAELAIIQPEVVVCLGATAAQSLMGRDFRVTRDRGTFFPHPWAKALMATVHPSALLRMPEPERREEEFRLLVRDLALISKRLRQSA